MNNSEVTISVPHESIPHSLPNPLVTTEGIEDGSWGRQTLVPREEAYASKGQDLLAFFAIGMVINVVVLAAFFVWAFKQWKKK